MDVDRFFGLYVHVPFCLCRCPYCDFNSVADAHPPWAYWSRAVQREIAARAPLFANLHLRSLYVGGGTPSLAPAHELGAIVSTALQQFSRVREIETTIEVNPADLDTRGFARLREAGFNRLSIGWQSGQARVLELLGRRHDAAAGSEAYRWARAAGFVNVSLDLIFAVPHQTLTELDRDLDVLGELAPEHISTYALTFHHGTDFFRRRQKGELVPVSEELEADMMMHIDERLQSAGLEHYEVSNFARPGWRAVHNGLYWSGARYLGVGPGAHSFFHDDWQSGRRWETRRQPEAYMHAFSGSGAGGAPNDTDPRIEWLESLSSRQLMSERMMCGLRTSDGVDLQEPVVSTYRSDIESGVRAAVQRGWATLRGQRLVPTLAGLLNADALAELFF